MAQKSGATMADFNRRIAEDVMEWELGEWKVGWYDENGVEVSSIFVWDPEHSIADAWAVVEKMREEGVYVTIGSNANGGWWCSIHNEGAPLGEVSLFRCSRTANTAPKAICEAALAAKARVNG